MTSGSFYPESSVEIVSARPWDILFLVSEVAVGTNGMHFSQTLTTAQGQRDLAWHLAKLLLFRLGLKFFSHPGLALVARTEGSTVGMIVTSLTHDEHGGPAELIDFAVVQDSFQNRGIGKALVEAVLLRTPYRRVRCYCLPESRAMQGVLRRSGFRRTAKPKVNADNKGQRMLYPAVYEWTRTGDTAP